MVQGIDEFLAHGYANISRGCEANGNEGKAKMTFLAFPSPDHSG
ncbi:MAG: hypothetical protein ACI9LO_002790 [Planctomycetota bacterium]|jgi:hypothetical protein